MKKLILLSFVLMAALSNALAQGEIPVNMYTGQPSISINLYTLTDHDLSESLTMSYNVNDVNLNSSSMYGLGWNLDVGGQISRQVRGLPDDFAGTGADTRKGWLYNNNYSSILTFPNSSSVSASVCDAFQDDYNYINNLQYKVDTEPDIFNYSVGGYSGKFVFDNTGVVQLIPFQQDLVIKPVYTNAPSNLAIIGWTITTNTGIVYTLNELCGATRSISKTVNQTYVNIFDRAYNLYSLGVTYTSAWMLTKTQSVTGASLTYTYTIPAFGYNIASNQRNVEFYAPKSGVTSDVFSLMSDMTSTTTKIVSTITGSSGKWLSIDPTTGIKIYDPVRGSSFFKQFAFGYSSGNLVSITESDGNTCIQLSPYQFTYNSWPSTGVNSSSQDYWGFFNGATNINSLNSPTYVPTIYVYPNESASERYRIYPITSSPGTQVTLNGDANRTPSPTLITSGTLNMITYPSGGQASFLFESNQYYDARNGTDQYGGGMRVKSITYSDGVNPTGNIVKNFSYVDGSGHSSGRLISRPSFVLPLWQQKIPTVTTALGSYTAHASSYTSLSGNAVWQDLVAIANNDISDQGFTQGSYVGYSQVTVTRPGSGKAVFNYSMPAGYGDGSTGSGTTDWSPTMMKFARPTTCPTMGIIASGENYGYPSFPQSEYDYERGLVASKLEYNNAGALVRQTLTTYQYIFKPGQTQPTKITGLAYDLYGNATSVDASGNNIYLYGRYSLLANVAKVALNETTTIYDENNAGRSATSGTQYSYTSANHRYLNQVKTTTSDGTVYGSYLTYVPDYPATASQTDTTSYMLYLLRNANRTSTVIESRNTIQPPGGGELTTSASLVKFRPFTTSPARPLVRYQLAFRPPTPVSSFTFSKVDNTSDVFSNDPRYSTVQTVNEYDQFDLPISATGENKITTGTLWGFGQRLPVAQFGQARSNSLGFSDFETQTVSSFAESNNYYGAGRTGVKGIHPYATLSRTNISKPSNASKYILSFWAKPVTAGGTLTLLVTLTYGASTINLQPSFSYDATSTDYQYFTYAVDVSAISTPTFNLTIQGQGFSVPLGTAGSFASTLLPLLDDIGFYPDFTSLTTTTYDVPFGANSVTDVSRATQYTTYDPVGRAKWLIDQDRNITKRFTYSYPGEIHKPLVASLASVTGLYLVNTPIVFNADPNVCQPPGITYSWSFDGGTWSTPSTSSSSNAKTYTVAGSYTVSLQVSDPSSGKSASTSFNVTIGTGLTPLTVTISSSGVGGNGYVTLTATTSNDNGLPSTYQWSTRPTGTATWNSRGATTSSYTVKIVPTTSMDFMCTVTSGDGRTGSSTTTVSN